jgi:beta-lactamase superfamily II metal-dependent hydrolase
VAANPSSRDLGIYFLDVGQGDCTVIVPPEGQGRAIIFDIADQYVIERFVANHELEIGSVVASHLDKDHIGGMLGFLRGHLGAGKSIDRIYLGPDRPVRPGKNRQLRELVEQTFTWAKAKPPVIIVKDNWRDIEYPLTLAEYDDDWRVGLVLPMNYTRNEAAMRVGPHSNMCSAVLRVERAGQAVLIGGDAPLGSWEQLEPDLLPARAIRAPHHGGDIREGGEQWKQLGDLYDRVSAELGVISVGTNNSPRWSHPHEDHALAIRRKGACRLLCTQLTRRCHEEPQLLRDRALRAATSVEYPYRHYDDPQQARASKRRSQEVPCAGTVVVWLDSSGELHHEPGPNSAHAQLLRRVDDPLCTREFDDE